MLEIKTINTHHLLEDDFAGYVPFTQSSLYARWQEVYGKPMVQTSCKQDGRILWTAQWKRERVPLGMDILYAPHGPCVRALDGEASEEALRQFAKQTDVVALYVDTVSAKEEKHLYSLSVKEDHSFMQPRNEYVVNLDSDVDAIVSKSKKRVRHILASSEARSCTVSHERDDAHKEQFLTHLCETARRGNFSTHPMQYYEALFHALSDSELNLITVREGDGMKGASGCFIVNGKEYLFLFGGSSEGIKVASYVLHQEAMRRAIENGCTTYNMGGVSACDGDKLKGVTFFKMGWGGSVIESAHPHEFNIIGARYNLYTLLRSVKNKIKG